MKKMKDYGQFINEMKSENDFVNDQHNDTINENILIDVFQHLNEIPDVFTRVFEVVGLLLGVASTGVFSAYILSLIGNGIWFASKDTKLGKRIKEMIAKLKDAYKKKDIDKDASIANIDNTLEEYEDVIQELENGKLGKGGQQAAKILNKTKELVNQAQAE